MQNQLVKIFIERDGMSDQEAIDYVCELRARVLEEGEDPEELLYEIGLEPDYIFDLI